MTVGAPSVCHVSAANGPGGTHPREDHVNGTMFLLAHGPLLPFPIGRGSFFHSGGQLSSYKELKILVKRTHVARLTSLGIWLLDKHQVNSGLVKKNIYMECLSKLNTELQIYLQGTTFNN